MRRLLLLALLAAPASVAQTATVTGTVRDASGTPLPGANVYLSGTTRGDAADINGRYAIEGIAPGAYRLVASMVGFAPEVDEIRLGTEAEVVVDFELEGLELETATVEAERDARWERRLAWFQRELIGTSGRADSTEILNPWVLDFRLRWGTLTATAREPLLIENRALGYRLRYDLHAFSASSARVSYDGDEQFTPLRPATAGQAARWATAREAAYRGSLAHLLRSLLHRTAEAEGFSFLLTYRDENDIRGTGATFRTDSRRLVRADDDGWGTLRVRGRLDVTYAEPEDPAYLDHPWTSERRRRPATVQTSGVHVRRSARFDPQGTPEDPFAISTSGYFGFERLADRVPEDYDPPGTTTDDGPRTTEGS
ncbi:MAG: carboxypeptidase-like regulatory domain-containing protein [Bacteroidota bacterium]